MRVSQPPEYIAKDLAGIPLGHLKCPMAFIGNFGVKWDLPGVGGQDNRTRAEGCEV